MSVDELERAQAIHPVASVQSELSLWTRDALDDGARVTLDAIPAAAGARY